MLDRRFLQDDEYAPTAAACGSAEPFRKPDHRAKKHPRPRNVDCRGRFALRRPKVGRVLASLEGEIGGEE
ncbi:hypothetical protein [Rhizobium sullae]|uniref:hypothetical protein n=1 Tax=Rhizobium sullae TaxID=50338 RepID=UPI000C297DF8|nr:hypothetical protein [Rhizobium sullae]